MTGFCAENIYHYSDFSSVQCWWNLTTITDSFYTFVKKVSTNYNKGHTSAHLYLYNCRPGTQSYLFTIYNDRIISLILSYKHKRNYRASDNWDNQPLPAISSVYWRQKDFFNGIILMSVCLNIQYGMDIVDRNKFIFMNCYWLLGTLSSSCRSVTVSDLIVGASDHCIMYEGMTVKPDTVSWCPVPRLQQ